MEMRIEWSELSEKQLKDICISVRLQTKSCENKANITHRVTPLPVPTPSHPVRCILPVLTNEIAMITESPTETMNKPIMAIPCGH